MRTRSWEAKHKTEMEGHIFPNRCRGSPHCGGEECGRVGGRGMHHRDALGGRGCCCAMSTLSGVSICVSPKRRGGALGEWAGCTGTSQLSSLRRLGGVLGRVRGRGRCWQCAFREK